MASSSFILPGDPFFHLSVLTLISLSQIKAEFLGDKNSYLRFHCLNLSISLLYHCFQLCFLLVACEPSSMGGLWQTRRFLVGGEGGWAGKEELCTVVFGGSKTMYQVVQNHEEIYIYFSTSLIYTCCFIIDGEVAGDLSGFMFKLLM